MRKKLPFLFLAVFLSFAVSAQQTYTVSVFNNAMVLPGSDFAGPIHPGFDLGWIYPLREKSNHETFLSFQLGYYYQRVVHQGVQLYGEYNYRHDLGPHFAVDLSAGLGYLHTFELHDIFKLNKSGQYERTGRGGKSHGQLSTGLAISYGRDVWPVRPFLRYRFRLIAPFVREYVPIVPGTSLHLGVFIVVPRLNNKKNEK